MRPRVLVVTEEDCGQREAASIYYAAYYLIPEGMTDEEAREAMRTGQPKLEQMDPTYALTETFEEPE